MTLPGSVRRAVRDRVWSAADQADWATLSDPARTRKYEEWTRDPLIGGVLGRYVDPKQVRVYLKDTIIKSYTITRGSDASRPYRLLGLPSDEPVAESYMKPHGRRLVDGRVICWGQARDWKSVITAVWERAKGHDGASACAAVLTGASGPWASDDFRAKAGDLAHRLGVGLLVWVDT